MKVSVDGRTVVVTLSADNARDIKAMADQSSSRTLRRLCENDMILLINVESNENHYRGRNYQGQPVPQGRGFRDANWRRS